MGAEIIGIILLLKMIGLKVPGCLYGERRWLTVLWWIWPEDFWQKDSLKFDP